jgi:phage baseplate assembly protein gpV
MSEDIAHLLARLDEQDFQIAELNRKLAGLIQVGSVTSFDPVNGAVADLGYATHSVPVGWHAGVGADWAPLKVGQQITMLCPSGDASNGFLISGGFHDANPPPSQSASEDIRAQRGTSAQPSRLRTTDAGSYLEAQGNSVAVENGAVTVTANQITLAGSVLNAIGGAITYDNGVLTLTASKIILAGQCLLGGADAAKPAAMQGTTDTGGYADEGNLATQVLMK